MENEDVLTGFLAFRRIIRACSSVSFINHLERMKRFSTMIFSLSTVLSSSQQKAEEEEKNQCKKVDFIFTIIHSKGVVGIFFLPLHPSFSLLLRQLFTTGSCLI